MVSKRQMIIKVEEEQHKLENEKKLLKERIKTIDKKIEINKAFFKAVTK